MLAQSIVTEGLRNVAAGADPMALKRGLDLGLRAVVDELRDMAEPVEKKERSKPSRPSPATTKRSA